VTALADGRADEWLAGVPRADDLVGRGAVEIGEYAVACMGSGEFERFIAAVRDPDSADAPPRHAEAGRGRRMSDQSRPGAAATGVTV